MIILSQDRNKIINFENVERIDVTTATNPVCFNINYETNRTRDLLGKYATEERAKEVFQEIIQNIYPKSNIDMDTDGISFGVQSPVYEMPLE